MTLISAVMGWVWEVVMEARVPVPRLDTPTSLQRAAILSMKHPTQLLLSLLIRV
jgi:hypothetical protein